MELTSLRCIRFSCRSSAGPQPAARAVLGSAFGPRTAAARPATGGPGVLEPLVRPLPRAAPCRVAGDDGAMAGPGIGGGVRGTAASRRPHRDDLCRAGAFRALVHGLPGVQLRGLPAMASEELLSSAAGGVDGDPGRRPDNRRDRRNPWALSSWVASCPRASWTGRRHCGDPLPLSGGASKPGFSAGSAAFRPIPSFSCGALLLRDW